MTAHPSPTPQPRPVPATTERSFRSVAPIPTLAAFGALAFLLWVNAAINHYRFNVAMAVLASVPVVVLLVMTRTRARRA